MAANWPDEFEERKKQNEKKKRDTAKWKWPFSPDPWLLVCLESKWKMVGRTPSPADVRPHESGRKKSENPPLLFTNFLEIARNCLSTNSIVF